LPKSIVIHIEKSGTIPDSYKVDIIDIKDDGSQEIIHRVVPVIKYWKFTDKDLIERKLYPLLPLQVFLLRSKLKKFAKETLSKDKQKVIQEIKDLTEKIITEAKNLAEQGKINKGDDDKIITALAKLIDYLNKQYKFDENLNQEVDTVIKSVFETLKEESKAEGKAEGREESKEEIAENFLRDGISKEIVIKNTGLSADQIEKISNKINMK